MTKYPVIQLNHGSVFKTSDGDILIKLMNPEVPRLANIADYPVWGADIGNGHIKKVPQFERVKLIGRLYDLMNLKEAADD